LKILLNQKKKIAEERKQEGGRGHPVVKKEIKIIQLDNFGQFIVSFFLSLFLSTYSSFFLHGCKMEADIYSTVPTFNLKH
jgi:hypothetical protein